MDLHPLLSLATLLGLFAGACAPAPGPTSTPALHPSQAGDTTSPVESSTRDPDALESASVPQSSLFFDAIHPIYEPEFVRAGDARLSGDEIVLGVTLNGEAKAYPLSVLRFREMVNDELAGIPILATF